VRQQVFLVAAVCLATGCAPGSGSASASGEPLSVSSYGGGSSGSFSGEPSSPALASPGGRATSAGVVVRPDRFELPFAFALEDDEGAALPALEAEVAALRRQLADATRRPVTIRMRTARFESLARSKSDEGPPKRRAIVEGCAELSVSDDLDFWARSRLLGDVNRLAAARHEKGGEKVRSTYGAVVPRVTDPEAHRPELVKRWFERSRSFVAAAEGAPAAGVRLSECTPPLEIQQETLGTDEVRLVLAVTCKLATDAAAPPK
jgi:hypothetical protein